MRRAILVALALSSVEAFVPHASLRPAVSLRGGPVRCGLNDRLSTLGGKIKQVLGRAKDVATTAVTTADLSGGSLSISDRLTSEMRKVSEHAVETGTRYSEGLDYTPTAKEIEKCVHSIHLSPCALADPHPACAATVLTRMPAVMLTSSMR